MTSSSTLKDLVIVAQSVVARCRRVVPHPTDPADRWGVPCGRVATRVVSGYPYCDACAGRLGHALPHAFRIRRLVAAGVLK